MVCVVQKDVEFDVLWVTVSSEIIIIGEGPCLGVRGEALVLQCLCQFTLWYGGRRGGGSKTGGGYAGYIVEKDQRSASRLLTTTREEGVSEKNNKKNKQQ